MNGPGNTAKYRPDRPTAQNSHELEATAMVAHAQSATRQQHVSLRDAAAYLGLTERTIRNYIADGRLTAYRLGPRQIRVRTDDLDALLRPIPTTGPAA